MVFKKAMQLFMEAGLPPNFSVGLEIILKSPVTR